MDKPLVTIITPSFNQGKFIRRTIESVLTQDYSNIEYIILDGGSTDETLEIIEEYDKKLTYFSERDDGQADAVNKGLRIARGEIIGWLNSDDTYLPGAVSLAVKYLQQNDQIGLVYGEGYHIDVNDQIIERYPTEKFDVKCLAHKCIICQPTAFIKKHVFDTVGLLDTKLHYCLDYELWMRISKHCEVGFIPEYLANSRMYAENKTLSNRLEVHKEAIDIIRKHYKYVPLNWIYGYCYLLNAGKKTLNFYLTVIRMFFKYNIRNVQFCFEEMIYAVKKLVEHTKEKKIK